MSSSFEKSVKGATKIKLAPPKAKYIEHILQATRSGEAGVAEIFRVLQFRIRDSTWTIAFKALIVVHLMIREGEANVTLAYISTSPSRIVGVNQYTDVQTQGRNIRNYSRYIIERARSFQKAKCDYAAQGAGRLQKLSIDKGLLKETESVQEQIKALLKCDFLTDEMENEISMTAFRLLTLDLLALYQVMNEGTMNVLERYFEMSRPDAERALFIYKVFTELTQLVITHLAVARHHEHILRIEIPKLKHAPTSLGSALEDYLNDRDFETNRRQYLAEREAKKGGKFQGSSSSSSAPTKTTASASESAFPQTKDRFTGSTKSVATMQAKGPAPDLIDFFDSIEQNQQPMAQQPGQYPQPTFAGPFQQQQISFAPQQTGFSPQQTGYAPSHTGFDQSAQFGSQHYAFPPQQQDTFNPSQAAYPSQTGSNPFGQSQHSLNQSQPQQLQTQFTGAGFGGYTPQPQAQPQQNFRAPQSDLSAQFNPPQQNSGGLQRQATNPFRQSTVMSNPTGQSSPFSPSSAQGTNPFGRSTPVAIPEDGVVQNFSPPLFPPSQTQSPLGASQQHTGSPFGANSQASSAQPLAPKQTGTNPFARNQLTATTPAALHSQPTETNPFRQSAFINQSTGQGWQNGSQGTVGGLPSQTFETVPVFPRPVGQVQGGYGQPQQQQPWG